MTQISTDLALADSRTTIQLVLELEAAGALTPTKLELNDPNMSYEAWESLGRFIGTLDRATRWWVGDWLNFGEGVFGEVASQGVEATVRERYSEAERVTGLDHGTLMNIRSICAKVAKERRRSELGFWVHAEAAPLEPAEQEQWLQKAISEGWTRAELRDAIRISKRPPSEDDADETDDERDDERLTPSERLEAAARIVYTQGQPTTDGSILVPSTAWAQLRAALGEE